MSVINSFLLAPIMTILIELGVVLFFGFRKKNEVVSSIFINLFTNPILNYFLWVNDYFSFFKSDLRLVLLLEIVVVFVEWRLLMSIFQEKPNKLLGLSFGMNFCSYVTGVLIFK